MLSSLSPPRPFILTVCVSYYSQIHHSRSVRARETPLPSLFSLRRGLRLLANYLVVRPRRHSHPCPSNSFLCNARYFNLSTAPPLCRTHPSLSCLPHRTWANLTAKRVQSFCLPPDLLFRSPSRHIAVRGFSVFIFSSSIRNSCTLIGRHFGSITLRQRSAWATSSRISASLDFSQRYTFALPP